MLQLQVQQIEQTCLFTLTWGQGQKLTAQLLYSQTLTRLYLDWQRSYQSFYRAGQRARAEDQGSIAPPPIDWRTHLAQAEVKLLGEFHLWLRRAELFEIRAQIGRCARETVAGQTLSLHLSCDRPELERLPWETWELGADLGATDLRIVRVPVTIRSASAARPPLHRPRRARILVILGDETGLDFQGDRAAVQVLASLAEIQFVGWQPGTDADCLRQEICQAIAAAPGWDVLLFAGHSNETPLLGGEIGIAPGVALSFRELQPYLEQAQQQGLQFALFNSCNGLELGRRLIDLGLGQVAIMREPIHNEAAQQFLRRFLQELAQHREVGTCLTAAAQSLKLEHQLTFPSTYLIPSLFCQPQVAHFRLPPRPSWRSRLRALSPQPWEAAALALLTATSLWLPAQDWLLDQRLQVQAIYRNLTGQIPTTPPPVLLVAIDEESVQRGQLLPPRPMNREYLAQLVTELTARQAHTIGIDYLLSRPPAATDDLGAVQQAALSTALQAAVASQVNLVLATVQQQASGRWQDPLPAIAPPNWSLHGSIHFVPSHVPLLPARAIPETRLPFAYLLALAHQPSLEAPQLGSRQDRFEQISSQLEAEGEAVLTYFSPRSQLSLLTVVSYRIGQMWLQPVIDFSLPPERIYQWLPAWQLLAGTPTPEVSEQVVLIAPGGYGEAGIAGHNQDVLPLPPAQRYWLRRQGSFREQLVGGEVHAYAIHHYHQRHFIVPIPQLWVLALAALLGKCAQQYAPSRRTGGLLLLGSTLYGLASLQLYITTQLLWPWLLPAIALSFYALSLLRQNPHS
ncbi:MAG: CHASE2 domain-containing protein [Spirulinaceae cyanobacterium SM2_1_0]|nr:CHASE2 domain-containing protein [Spirulinaceae cyanobacterium SM2_1_0]